MAEVKDPVCGMIVDEDDGLWTEYDGTTYYFCSEACLETFLQNPDEHIAGAA